MFQPERDFLVLWPVGRLLSRLENRARRAVGGVGAPRPQAPKSRERDSLERLPVPQIAILSAISPNIACGVLTRRFPIECPRLTRTRP